MNGNGMMDMFRSQLMTMTMFSTMNGNNKQSGGGSSTMTDSLYGMLYIFLITQFVDFLCKNVPHLIASIVKYYKNKINSSKLVNSLSVTINNQVHIKSSSIIIKLSITDNENIIGQALMDFITNNNNTKHVSFNKTNFILNQEDIIEIADEIFIQLVETTTTNEDVTDPKKTNNTIQTINLFSYTLTMHQLRGFLDKTTHEFKLKLQNKLGTDIYYFNQMPQQAIKHMDGSKDYTKMPNNCIFSMKKFYTNRKFENLFGPEIDIIRNRVEFFCKNKKWYDKKGIPYTLGLLLSGQAGAGKTSTIKCLANETHRHIININLNNDITKNQLESLFFNEVIFTLNVATGKTEQFCIPLEHRIYVLEDIDCQSDMVMERSLKTNPILPMPLITKNTETGSAGPQDTSQKIDLSFLLNLLDGILETPGRIIIMTSNHPKLLDHALIRPGRIDVIADFKKCDNETIIEMIEYFYDVTLDDTENDLIMQLIDYTISPAEMGKIMFENFNDYTHAIKKVVDAAAPFVEPVSVSVQVSVQAQAQAQAQAPTQAQAKAQAKAIDDSTSLDTIDQEMRDANRATISTKDTQQKKSWNDRSARVGQQEKDHGFFEKMGDYLAPSNNISYKNFANAFHQDDTHLGSREGSRNGLHRTIVPFTGCSDGNPMDSTFKQGLYGDQQSKDDLFGGKFQIVEDSSNNEFNNSGLSYSSF